MAFALTLGFWAASVAAALTKLRAGAVEGSLTTTAMAEVQDDHTGRLGLKDVLAPSADWQPGPASALSFGCSRSAYWVRWAIQHDCPRPVDLVLELGNARQDHVHWYVLDGNGIALVDAVSGDRLPFAQRLLPARRFALPLRLAPGQRLQVLVRLASQDGLYQAMPSMLYTLASFDATNELQDVVLSRYHGGMLALVLYNLLLFFATRDRAFGLYVGFMVSLLGWSVVFQAYPFKDLWPEATAFNNNVLTVCAARAFGIFGFFTVEYLQPRKSAPRWVLRLVQALAWANMAVVVPAALDFYALGAGIVALMGVAMAASALGAGIWLLAQGQRQARLFVLAFAALGVGASAYILQVIGVVPVNAFTTWGLQVGSGFEALVLALGLADAMNALKAQKLQAERRERQTQQALNTQLENKLEERTRELERANRRLHALAVTDELTGAFNRRQFNDTCASLLATRSRDEPLAMRMFDLCFFKRYSERYGHHAGDEVLRSAAAAVQRCLQREDDALFRLGGEEFAVLYTAASEVKALALAERLRSAIAVLNIPHADNPSGIVTASFGVAFVRPDPANDTAPEMLYAAAVGALYAALAEGRDRVIQCRVA